MAPSPLKRFRDWIGSRIERQIAAQSMLVTLTVGILLSAISISMSLWMAQNELRQEIGNHLDQAAIRLEAKVDTLLASAEELSKNPVVTMALLDSKGRDAYLVPFLENYRFPLVESHSVALCDYNGEIIAQQQHRPPGCLREIPEARAVLDTEKRQTTTVILRGKPYLILLQPVLFPGTGRAEGYVATSLDLESVMDNPDLARKDQRLTLASKSRNIDIRAPSSHGNLAEEQLSATRPVFTGNRLPIEGFELMLESPLRVSNSLPILSLIYTASILLMAVLTALLSVRRARRLASPLKELNAAARQVAAEGPAGHLIASNRRDEIGELTASLNDMVAALARAHETLEAEVEERTRQLQEALVHAENANRAKSAFLANMSHEVRTPMNAIIGLSDLAVSQAETPELRDYLIKIHGSAKALLGILNDILDYSKIEAGRLEIESIGFPVGEIIENIHTLFCLAAEEKGIALTETLAPEVPRYLIGDPLRLGQVLSNLVGNAIKFTGQGVVRLEIEPIEEREDIVRLRFSVRDTGIGIDPKVQGELFQPFTQADGSITRRFGGTGLGLAITQRLVTLMGGTLGVESRPGEGSTFTVDLPFRRADPAAVHRHPQAHPAQPHTGLDGRRILLVEDNPINQQVAAGFLRQWGIEVAIADNGEKALERLAQEPFDAVLMDLQMPVMGGIEAVRRLRENPRFARLPVIAMTAATMVEDRAASEAAGMNDFIPKPIEREMLAAVLERWLHADADPGKDRPASADASPAPPSLPTVPGFNPGRLKEVLGDDRELLRLLLRSFLEDNRDAVGRIQALLSADRITEAEHAIHALKGVASNLGAERLAGAAHALSLQLRRGEAPDAWPEVRAELESVLNGISTFLGEESSPAGRSC